MLLDKLVIAGLLGGAGLYINARMERRKVTDGLRKAVAKERVKAYQELWTISIQPVDETTRSSVLAAMENWYARGGALFLPLEAAKAFFQAKRLLIAEGRVDEGRLALSRLRTELKYDCGIYTRSEAETQIPQTA